MKIRLKQPGFENLTGGIGTIEFEDGLSVRDVTDNEARRFAATMLVEIIDGEITNPAQALLDAMNQRAEVVADTPREDEPVAPVAPTAPVDHVYTREELEAIADKDGVKGLRAIAEPRGVKAKSITDLIEGVLKSQETVVS